LKLLRTIIFICTALLLTTVSNRALASSRFSFQQVVKQTDSVKKDTTKIVKKMKRSSLDSKLEYFAEDSARVDKKNEVMHLYGKARVVYEDFQLDAEYIRFNSKENTIFARGITNEKGKYVGKPIFKMGNEAASNADLQYPNGEGKN
jgi:lipopolysaccharide assembly outer membrane protein LptD (OstA)